GSVVSRMRGDSATSVSPYVNLNDLRVVPGTDDPEVPRYMGPAHGPFRPTGPGLANLRLPDNVSFDRLDDRRALLAKFDRFRRQAEASDAIKASSEFQQRAFGMVASNAIYQ